MDKINNITVNQPIIMNTEKIDLKSLSPNALKELKAAVAQEEKEKKQLHKENVESF